MADTLYTTTENIRAALGVTAKELSEELMAGLQLDIQLEIELDTLIPGHALIAAAGQAGSPTPEATKAWNQLRVLAQYQGALILLDNAHLWTVQKISDGDFDMQRFTDDALASMRMYITDRRNIFVGTLNPAYVTTVPVQVFTRVTPAYDPVTDE